jgi:uncharacterized protein
MEVTIENSLLKFIRILRHLGVRISIAEAIDSYKALQYIDLSKPLDVKATLQTTLVKDKASLPLFDLAFNSFFVPMEEKEQHLAHREEMVQEHHAKLKEVEAQFVLDSSEIGDKTLPEEVKLDLTDEQKMTYSKMPQEAKDKLQGYINEHLAAGNQVNSPHNLLERMVQGQLNYWKRRLQAMEEEEPTSEFTQELLDEFNSTGEAELDDVIERVNQQLKADQDSILYEDMASILDKDIPKVTALIRKLSRKLATRISRRFHQSNRKRVVDIRKSIRRSISYGGTIMELKYKSKRINRPKIVLICDVSGSMARYASFIIQFVYGLSSVVDSIESFIFSEDLERISPYFKSHQPFEGTMTKVMNESKEWGKATNLNIALNTFATTNRRLLTHETVIIIVSDGKTLDINQAGKKLDSINKQVKEVIWLNTLPIKEWANNKSVNVFKKYSRMFECYTLAHLEKVLRRNIW